MQEDAGAGEKHQTGICEHKETIVTDYQVKEAAFRICLKYKDGDKGPTYTFNEKTLLEFARILLIMENNNEQK